MADVIPANIVDKEVRQRALDPEHSFVVQAPAGSGKTELLTQRFLQMLARVDAPEEILAVTFTRKAAAEMRNRIINAIYPPPGRDERLAETIELAAAVHAREHELGWQLQKHPSRLRIRTIDSVNAWLSSTAPILGQGGGVVSDTPFELYREAAMRTVQQVTESGRSGAALRNLLQHLDNRTHTLIGLLATMLARRDQWLQFVFDVGRSDTVRDELEATLEELVAREIEAAAACIPADCHGEVIELLQFAGNNLVATEGNEHWALAENVKKFPEPDPAELPAWQLIAELLLTKSGGIRKTVDVRSGFPPGDGENGVRKEQAKKVFAAVCDYPDAAAKIKVLSHLPEPGYSDEQWELLKGLLEVLHVAAAELMLVFADNGAADYPAVARNALEALAGEDGPTDLALRLDYVVQHVLIDEFQDTSSAQKELLEALTAGWSTGDGRTLFLVGDPMQSIYRFRKAEVGLFLDLQEKGLPNVELESLRLQTNFRSDPVVVDWVNAVFSQVMPETGDRTSGAVSYEACSAAHGPDETALVRLHPLLKPSRVREAQQVIDLLEQTLREFPPDQSDPENSNKSIGVLVRARAHAALIAQGLRERGIRFSGTGLENSIDTQVVQDLLCLTRALTHRGDRTAWLGLLRGPWCGLTLVDVEALAGGHSESIWDLLCNDAACERMSDDGYQRARRLTGVLEPLFSRRGALPLRDIVEGVWVQLGGPAFLRRDNGESADLLRAQAFFDVLDSVDTGGDIADAFNLHEQIADQLAIEDSGAPVNLLTIHKAKGLEFDTVILPALEVTPPAPDKPVLAWQEVVRTDGQPGLVIAPVESIGYERDPVYELARRLNAAQESNEKDRLLYVAATRARLRLHLFYGLGLDKDGELKDPAPGSLIGRLWPALDSSRADVPDTELAPEAAEDWLQPVISRCATNWRVPAAPPVCDVHGEGLDTGMREVSFDWAGSTAMHVGRVVHRCLQFVAERGEFVCPADEVLRAMLLEEGVESANLKSALERVIDAIRKTLDHEQGQWTLQPHEQAASELAVTAVLEGRVQQLVLDRTFVAEDGSRWIIDYKTSVHEGGNLEGFIDSEVERYTDKLTSYRMAMQLLEPERDVRTALYFPLLGVFREVPART